MEEIRKLREMISKIPGTPEPIEKVSEIFYAETPFTDEISSIALPDNFKVPNMNMYDGSTDPRDHIAHFKQRMMCKPIPKHSKEACMCKAFGASLTGSALEWYINLPSCSVNSFADLVTKFNTQFGTSRKMEKRSGDLYNVVQNKDESLRDYLYRFNSEMISIKDCHQAIAVSAFHQGLSVDSEFYKELTKYFPNDFDELRQRAQPWIRLEEVHLTEQRNY